MASGAVYRVSNAEARAVADAFVLAWADKGLNTLIGFKAQHDLYDDYEVRVNAAFIESVSEEVTR
jgi:hypothetical protein